MNRYTLAQGEIGAGVAISTPAWRTDIVINSNMYGHGHGDGHEDKDMFSIDEFPTIDIVKNGKIRSFGLWELWDFCTSGIGMGIQRQVAYCAWR